MHCFEYGRGQQPELEKYCTSVSYYKRNNSFVALVSHLPYIVSSRKNEVLFKNLLKDNYPVLLEGIHCTYYLYKGALQNRKVIVRLHNVEYEYYRELAGSSRNFLNKIFYMIESLQLKKYEFNLANKAMFLAVNEKDRTTYQQTFHCKQIEFLPVFLPFQQVKSKTGMGSFCLYQGNLSVPENEKAVVWLLENIFDKLDVEFVIAGKNPTKYLRDLIAKNKKVILIPNPSNQEMASLIENAHIHLLPSFNITGIKIKLLNALFKGRFIVTNHASVEGTNLEVLCTIAETPEEYKKAIQTLLNKDFTEEMIVQRNFVLQSKYDNKKNAIELIKLLF
ncbi:MAG: glycosyltransferase family 4 protein [Ginsengibacter sp.]